MRWDLKRGVCPEQVLGWRATLVQPGTVAERETPGEDGREAAAYPAGLRESDQEAGAEREQRQFRIPVDVPGQVPR